MFDKPKNYIAILMIHFIIGVMVYFVKLFSPLYVLVMVAIGFFIVFKSKNKNNEVLYFMSYLVGAEVFLRMTDGNPNHEFTKYCLIILSCIGIYFKGFNPKSIIFFVFILFLLPGIFIAVETLSLSNQEIRKTIAFNISGELSLAFAAMYCYGNKVSIKNLMNILLFAGLPLVCLLAYLTLYTPNLKEVLTGTGSNFETSGGFGPNQVATVLGLGMFVFFCRLLFSSKSLSLQLINAFLVLFCAYRGLLTFSRGGVITAIIMIVLLVIVTFRYLNTNSRKKLIVFMILAVVSSLITWGYTEYKTFGLMSKRYMNQDARGRVKTSKFSGREAIAEHEIKEFITHPFWGIGVGRGADKRTAIFGSVITSHNEITRMLAEHGVFGIFDLAILFLLPVINFFRNRQNLFGLCFVLFWLLTINHAAMRTAAPAFIYALSLLAINFQEPDEDSLHRQQAG